MPGADVFTDSYGVRIACYWQDSTAEVPQAHLVAAWLDEIRSQYPDFRPGLVQIDIWSPKHPGIYQTRENGRIAGCAGLMYGDGVLLIHGHYANPGCLSHEIGHWQEREFLHARDEQGQRMRSLWLELRGWEATGATPPAERWAEDFRALFGCAGVRGTTSPGDDGQRKPWDVAGLRALMLALPAVLAYWRRVGWISSATVSGGDEAVQWLRTHWWFWRRWERWRDGQFETWDGIRWSRFNP